MIKKICCFLTVILLNIALGSTTLAKSDYSDYNSSHLRIFTPFHEVKSVYLHWENQDHEIQVTGDDIKLIAGVVHAESKGEPFEGKVGVASVILNRLCSPQFPKSVKDVIFQKNAFSCINNGSVYSEPDMEAYKAVEEALNGNDPTGDAVFFYNPKTASSEWMINASKCEAVTIGSHVFFK